MNPNDLSKWMEELQAVVGPCKFSRHTVAGAGLRFEFWWMEGQAEVGYEKTISAWEMKNSNDNATACWMDEMKCNVIALHRRHSGH